MRAIAVSLSLALALPAAAAEQPSWDEYMKQNRYKCPGPLDTLKAPVTVQLAGKSYKHDGYKLEVQSNDQDSAVKVGVISAIKDVSPGTKHNISQALDWFKSVKAEWVVVNGDVALEEFDLEEVMGLLAQGGLPTLVTLGNSESKSSFARVYREVAEKHPNVINGVWVRQIVADDVELWTVSGYHDKKFVHQGAGCTYGKEDVDLMLKGLKPAGDRPVVLISHGPPLGNGPKALDWISDKKNVGDPELTRLIQKANIPFGFFGHILEAGGAVVGKDLATAVGPGKLLPQLYLNAGSLSGDPWGLNDGTTSTGMAFLVTFEGQQAKYELKRFKPPAEE